MSDQSPDGLVDSLNFKDDTANNRDAQKRQRADQVGKLDATVEIGKTFEDLKRHPAFKAMHSDIYMHWMRTLEQCGDPKTESDQIRPLQAAQQALKSVLAYADEKIVAGQRAQSEIERLSK